MLTENQKKQLEEKIYRLIKESIFEKMANKNVKNNSHHKHNDNIEAKRDSVEDWLDSAQVNHAALAYELYNDEDANETKKGTDRSEFSKKERGEDANGNPYDFTDAEINKLYNMKDTFISNIN